MPIVIITALAVMVGIVDLAILISAKNRLRRLAPPRPDAVIPASRLRLPAPAAITAATPAGAGQNTRLAGPELILVAENA